MQILLHLCTALWILWSLFHPVSMAPVQLSLKVKPQLPTTLPTTRRPPSPPPTTPRATSPPPTTTRPTSPPPITPTPTVPARPGSTKPDRPGSSVPPASRGTSPGPEFGNFGPPDPRKNPPPKNLKPDINTVKNLCQKMPGGCKGMSEKAKKSKDAMREYFSKPRKNGKPKKTDQEIKVYFNALLKAKKVIVADSALTDVIDPNDDGFWAGDQVLSMHHLHRIINSSNDSGPLNVTLARQKRATGISLDYYTGNKWPTTTVNFYIDPYTFDTDQANLIRTAIKTIEATTCLTFQETLNLPHIEFQKTPYGTSASTCGWATLGYSGEVNDAAINFDSSLCTHVHLLSTNASLQKLKGTVVHEVLHVLGISHEQNRYDRDQYIEMDWTNIDPQSYDIYSHDNSYDYNPHCVGYDYMSVMHYSPYVAVVDASKPAFKPITNPDHYLPLIGTANAPSATDLALVNRLYCVESSCRDSSPYCGWTACSDCASFGSVCQKSCGLCKAV